MESSTTIKPQWFTEEFLETILKTSENDKSLKITQSNISDAVEEGANYGSTMFRITMDVTGETSTTEKKSMVIKGMPQKGLKDIASESTMFPREIKMFSEILPRMHESLKKVMPGVEAFGAKHYYSEIKMPYVLMLEDLSVTGFKMADKATGLDLPHSIMVMKNLGRFHASSIPMYEINPEMFRLFEKSIVFESITIEQFFIGFLTNQIKRVIEAVEKWDSGGTDLVQKITRRLERIQDDIKILFSCNPDDFNVLIHGDLWVNNMMFRYDEVTGNVQDIKFVDYQGCTINSPAIDLQCFIHTSVRNDVRENYTEELLKIYHEELTKTLTILGCTHKVISFEKMLEVYENKAVLGLIWSLAGLPFLMVERGVAQDIDAMSKLDSPVTSGGSISKECEVVLKSVLNNFENKGLL